MSDTPESKPRDFMAAHQDTADFLDTAHARPFDLLDMIERQAETIASLRGLIWELEWSQPWSHGDSGLCPCCGAFQWERRHSPDCRLKSALENK